MTGCLLLGFLGALAGQSLFAQQAISPSAEASDLPQIREQRRSLQQDFQAVMEANRDKSPEERKAAVQAWRQANQAQLDSLREQESQASRANRSASRAALSQEQMDARFSRRAPEGLAGTERELWLKRQELRQSRFALMQYMQGRTPEQRQAATAQWEQDNQALMAEVETLREGVAKKQPAGNERRGDAAARREVRELLRERAMLARSLKDATPADRAAAMQAWDEEKGALLQAKRQQSEVRSTRPEATRRSHSPPAQAP